MSTNHDEWFLRHRLFNQHGQPFIQPQRNWQVTQEIMGQFMHEDVLGGIRGTVGQGGVRITFPDENARTQDVAALAMIIGDVGKIIIRVRKQEKDMFSLFACFISRPSVAKVLHKSN